MKRKWHAACSYEGAGENMTAAVAATTSPTSTLVSASGASVRSQSGGNVSAGFDAALAQANGTPQSLLPDDKKTESTTQAVKIARSYKMECADEVTKTQEVEGYSFDDFVDLINPLQHIPVIGSLYREVTGNTIRPDVQAAGGFLLGAVTGGVLLAGASSIITAAFDESTGAEPAVHVANALFGTDKDKEGTEQPAQVTQVAQAATVEQETAPVAQKAEPVTSAPLTVASADPVKKTAKPLPPDVNVLMNTPGQMRVGNTVYMNQQMRTAAAKAAPPSTNVKTTDTTNPVTTDKAHLDNQTFGSLLQQQAQAHEQGNTLPPELVHDMMLMALDKYKAAQANTGATSTVQ